MSHQGWKLNPTWQVHLLILHLHHSLPLYATSSELPAKSVSLCKLTYHALNAQSLRRRKI